MEKGISSSEKHQNLHQITPFSEPKNLEFQKLHLKETKLLATWLFQKPTNTRIAYESDIKKFFGFFRGKTLRDISSTHLVVFLKNHPELKDSSKARIRSSISSLYKFLIKERYIDTNPALGVDQIKVPDQTAFKILDQEAIERMIEVTEKKRDRFFIRLVFRLGLRASEACSIKLSHFKKQGTEHYVIVSGKGNKTRTLWVAQEDFEEAMSFEVEGETLEIPLFRAKNTLKPINRVSAWKIIKKAAQNAKIHGNVSPHWLRHSHATIALEKGADLRVIQNTLGHDSVTTTIKYTKVRPGNSSSKFVF